MKNNTDRKRKLLIERDVEFTDMEITESLWKAAGDMARLPDEATTRLMNHILTIKLKERGEESVIAIQEGINRYLYPDPKMLLWGERQLKRNPELTPSELAFKYAKVFLENARMGPSLIRDMQKLKSRVQMQETRAQWRRLSGRKVNERIKMPRPRIPANSAYYEKVIESRLKRETVDLLPGSRDDSQGGEDIVELGI